ncbi:phosphatase PAP2 family protein [Flavobacterium psychroterrae]|uniref:Phosphatase PAP2 family protein n=1 Tax=Flavobacterium psychroterrae TaxID=2133767 RepID=A0ABS5PCC1_9FLAO|nr:phosphatase PAP2 family protein [Flavobacterium psychroterrae]MBS7231505.1 phosphatase PAP2 family protein [Flavobacterium psychroterrae]
MKKIIILSFVFHCYLGLAQNKRENDSMRIDTVKNIKFSYKQLIIPAVLIGYGFWGNESGQIKSFNHQIRDEFTEDIDRKVSIDDFSRYVPAVSVYALNAFGVKGKNNMRDRSVILATSFIIMTASVFTLKSITNVERPDGTSNNSFPSGHTAVAFAGAEFLYQEYKDQSVWYGVAGYAVATGTGIFRMYNNRHWLTDVAAGAGIGILSTKIAYWTNPYITRKLFGKKEAKSTSFLTPSYDGKNFAIYFIKTF